MKIIFLDIDGPMIPATMYLIDQYAGFRRIFPETTVAVLKRMCENTGAKLVINSTHNTCIESREVDGFTIHTVEETLKRNHGFTDDHFHPDSRTRYPAVNRLTAVTDWLALHPEVTDWVAIDDNNFTDNERLILVNPDTGIGVDVLNKVCEKLGGKPTYILI